MTLTREELADRLYALACSDFAEPDPTTGEAFNADGRLIVEASIRLRSLAAEAQEWDKDYDQNVLCQCGHPYYRHFDTYDEMAAVGCKYCGCSTFKPVTPSPARSSTGEAQCECYRRPLSKGLRGDICAKCGKEIAVLTPPSTAEYRCRLCNAVLPISNPTTICTRCQELPPEPAKPSLDDEVAQIVERLKLRADDKSAETEWRFPPESILEGKAAALIERLVRENERLTDACAYEQERGARLLTLQQANEAQGREIERLRAVNATLFEASAIRIEKIARERGWTGAKLVGAIAYAAAAIRSLGTQLNGSSDNG